MGKINLSRVILGGIVAGIVINVSEWLLHDVVMKEQFEARRFRRSARPRWRAAPYRVVVHLELRARDHGRLALRRDPARATAPARRRPFGRESRSGSSPAC